MFGNAISALDNNSICYYMKVICTCGFRPPSWLLGTRWYTNMIVLQSAANEATFKVLYTMH